jgi:hypothetical protein
MAREIRFDRYDFSKTRKTKEGYLHHDSAVVTRTGVFKYVNPKDGSVRLELRHPDEVFRKDSMDTLRMLPVVNGHPSSALVNATTARKYQCGHTGENYKRDGNFVRLPVTVTDEAAVKDVEGGRNKLSLGYETDTIKEDGTYEGQPYTHRQTNITYNHLALVDVARAGDVARLDGEVLVHDSEDKKEWTDQEISDKIALLINEGKPKDQAVAIAYQMAGRSKKDGEINNENNHTRKETKMAKITLDGIEYEAAPEVINALTKANQRADSAEGVRDTLKAENATLKNRNLDGEVKAAVTARIALERKASVCLDGEDVSSLSDRELKSKVIVKQFPTIKLDGKSDDYVAACFDNAIELVEKARGDEGMRSQRQQSGGEGFRGDGNATDPVESARARMVARMQGKTDK